MGEISIMSKWLDLPTETRLNDKMLHITSPLPDMVVFDMNEWRKLPVYTTLGIPLQPDPFRSRERPKSQNHKTTTNRKWQDYVYIQCEYKSTKQKIKHLLREENKVKENKIS